MKIVKIVRKQCLPICADNESKAFFQKMIGDYYRYVAESMPENDEIRQGALEGYTEA